MRLLISLGNPGQKYRFTRHNIGFRVLDFFRRKNNFPDFHSSKRFFSLVSEGRFSSEKIILAKPQTFMNKSGKAASELVRFYKLDPSSLIVVHDDVDFNIGDLKVIYNKGSAGHKGVQSVIDHLGTKEFVRLRIGTKPRRGLNKGVGLEEMVLKGFTKEEKKVIKKSFLLSVEAIECLICEGLEKTMNKFNS